MDCAVVQLLVCALLCGLQVTTSDLVHVDLGSQKAWTLRNANQSISLPATVPAHALSVLASAGVIAQDPLYRYGERDTRWVGEDTWNFTLIWSSKKHEFLTACHQVMLVLHGLDTFATVVLNGQHVLWADNAHRSWWLPLPVEALREGANMLTILLHPAADLAARAQLAYPYPVPTMQVPGGAGAYNFARKPASDFGWDWGPAFVPAGVSGGVELVGFDRATLIGALVTQHYNSSSAAFDLIVTAQLVVPAEGDSGTLSLTLAQLDLHTELEVELQPGTVGGNQVQALATIALQVPSSKVKLWQPLTQLPKGKPRELYDLAVMFEPTVDPEQQPARLRAAAGTCGVAPDSSSSSTLGRAPEPEIRSTVVRRIGFRTIELVREPVQAAAKELLQPEAVGGLDRARSSSVQHKQQQDDHQRQPLRGSDATQLSAQTHNKHQQEQQQGESFFFKVNGIPLYAKGANLIPFHVLSTAVTERGVRDLLQSAVDANMNMIRIWGGGLYQIDELYEAANELGLLVWQEAMFACSPYPRNAAFLANVKAELTQQLLRLGSHASLAVFGGNNEVEQSLEWYGDTKGNLGLYAADYSALFEHTIGKVVQKMLPWTPWVDSSPSKGDWVLPESSSLHSNLGADSRPPAAAAAAAGKAAAGAENSPAAAAATAAGADSIPAAAAAATAAGADSIPAAAAAAAAATAAGGPDHKQDVDGVGSNPEAEVAVSSGTAKAGASSTGTGPRAEPVMGAGTAGGSAVMVKRWGNTNDPLYGDVHFYNYRDDCQDWRTYPHARFISEYGWQSYPSWSTYAAATAEEDWSITAAMTEYRQRHPNGTAELLAQLQRRFKLPHAWLELLPQQQQQQQGQPEQHQPPKQQQQQQLQDTADVQMSVWAFMSQVWSHSRQLGSKVSAALCSRLGLQLPVDTATDAASSSSSSSSSRPAGSLGSSHSTGSHPHRAEGLAPGTFQRASTADLQQHGGSSSSSSSRGVREASDMQHFVYLTQVQQMLCYETALHTWRRLRSDPGVLSMGVLYWQLNDVWAGASWSSIDYGGVWKPVQYGVARAFADVSLSVQHDFQEDTISIYAVNDLQAAVPVQLAVRLLSLSDTPASCHPHHTAAGSRRGSSEPSSGSSEPSSGSSEPSSGSSGPGYAFQAAPYNKFHHMDSTDAPAAAATLLWSASVSSLLKKSNGACSRVGCYVHIALAAEGLAGQEATVWLASFKDLPLQDPQLAVEGLKTVGRLVDEGSGLLSSAGRQQEALTFTVSSQAVAAFVVWEMQAGALPGQFDENVVTVHPCEPREVRFSLRGSTRAGLLQVVQEQLVVTSLWDHQQFDMPEKQQQQLHEALIAF